jgi:NTE family protein
MMQRSKTALVLAGGGIAGAAYEIGAVCAIDQLLGLQSVNEFDIYVGTSAGGLVSACLANNISPRTILSVLNSSTLGIDRLEPHHLYDLNINGVLRRFKYIPTALRNIFEQLTDGRRERSWLDLIETLSVALPTGLFDNHTLEQFVRSALTMPGRSNRFDELPHELAIVATDLDSGERAVFGQEPLADVPISQAVAASAAIPIFYRPVRIDGRDYIDGGVRGTASLDVAIERGAELIICINPMVPYDNREHPPEQGLRDEGIHRVGNQVFRTFVHAGLHYHIKQVRRRHPEVDIILIEPSRDDRVMFSDSTMRYQTRLTIARHGFETVARDLNAHYEYYKDLMRRHGIRISRAWITRDLQALQQAGDDIEVVRQILVADGAPHNAPGGLTHTLAELDRVLRRIEERQCNQATPEPRL